MLDPDQTFVAVQVAVRHGKSELITKYFVVWFLGLFPEKQVVISCYNEEFAKKWGRETRDLYAEWGPQLFGHDVRSDVSSATEWTTTAGGGVRAVGAGGSITGLGFDLIVIDDPIKNAEEAASPAQNEKMRDWYQTTLRTRLKPKVVDPETGKVLDQGGTIVLTMARWTDYDLTAFVLGEIESGEKPKYPDTWVNIQLPAVAEAPSGAGDDWVDEIGRHDGEPLWPEVWSLEALQPMMGTAAWDSLYQQNPVPKGGGTFAKADWQRRPYPQGAEGWRRCRFWDTAATKGGGDWSVGVLMAVDPQGLPWVLDVVRKQVSSAELEALIRQTAASDGRGTSIRYEEAKAAAGKAVTTNYAKLLLGFDFKGVPVTGTKAVRATMYASAQQNGLVRVAEADWTDGFIEEHARFPKGRHDDQVDAAAGAFNELTGGGEVTVTSPSQVAAIDPAAAVKELIRRRPRGGGGGREGSPSPALSPDWSAS